VLSAFARALGQAPDYFQGYFTKPLTQLRLLHYPSSHSPTKSGDVSFSQQSRQILPSDSFDAVY